MADGRHLLDCHSLGHHHHCAAVCAHSKNCRLGKHRAHSPYIHKYIHVRTIKDVHVNPCLQRCWPPMYLKLNPFLWGHGWQSALLLCASNWFHCRGWYQVNQISYVPLMIHGRPCRYSMPCWIIVDCITITVPTNRTQNENLYENDVLGSS